MDLGFDVLVGAPGAEHTTMPYFSVRDIIKKAAAIGDDDPEKTVLQKVSTFQ